MFGFKITQKEIQERIDFYKNLKNAPINLPKKLLNPHFITQNTRRYLVDEERFGEIRKRFILVIKEIKNLFIGFVTYGISSSVLRISRLYI